MTGAVEPFLPDRRTGDPVEVLDRFYGAALARTSAGISPVSLYHAHADWLAHLASSPGTIAALTGRAGAGATRLAAYAACSLLAQANAQEPECLLPAGSDRRFSHDAWRVFPFDVWSQGFLQAQEWWREAAIRPRGVEPRHARVVDFVARQLLDMLSPSNFFVSNPEILERTFAEGGANLARGARNAFEDWQRELFALPPAGTESYRPGDTVAATPGRVVYRNHLIELLRYEPTTASVRPEPILIVPAWIMKYYILDLSPANSLVRYLVDRGFTVFIISWRNPDAGDRDLSFEDYRQQGPLAAIDAVGEATRERIHLAGYCLGGTLSAIQAAHMAATGDERLASLTLLAAQTDFSEPGEIGLFVDEGEVDALEDLMWAQGFLHERQMAGAFQMLRSQDLIWSRLVRHTMLGERRPPNDLMAWNADATRLPYRMHSDYLRSLYLRNDLAEGRYAVAGTTLALSDIRVPIFAVGTERDHVSPWRSVYKVHLLTDTEVTFCLTNGGHNAGIVSEPGHEGRHYRSTTRGAQDRYVDPDRWLQTAPPVEGSWWPVLADWLERRSGRPAEPPPWKRSLGRAPGRYVHMN